jgi:hypothetical protein
VGKLGETDVGFKGTLRGELLMFLEVRLVHF